MATRTGRRAGFAPLYDSRFEHDACGIGFVAGVSPASRPRVLPLALAGLAALGHRGAFAADRASSDGAGLLLPLEPAMLARLGGSEAPRPGVVWLFAPRRRADLARTLTIVVDALAIEGLAVERWREVPVRPEVLGGEAAASRPAFFQAIVGRPPGWSDDRFEAGLVLARRRSERAAQAEGLGSVSFPSASCRVVVYKGLVDGSRLAELYPDLQLPLPIGHALFHQRYATNTRPDWRLAQPFRHIAHNGEINTVRGNREQVRGRAADPTNKALARRLLAAGPLLSEDGSDTLSLDEAVEGLVMTGWTLPEALLALVPEALALRRDPHPLATAYARRIAGSIAPWDGPAALVFSDGRRVGALLDRNGLRPAAFSVTKDGLVALASEAGAIPTDAAETVRRGRLGPGELLLVDTRRGLVLEDGEAKTEVLRRSWVPDAPRVTFVDRLPPSTPYPPTPAGLRYLGGLDAERHRLHVKTLAIEGREPLWSMGDDTPTPGRARVDRPVTDHLRQAFAQVTNPPIDPERERAVLDLAVEVGPRPPLLGGLPPARDRRTLLLRRPYIADLNGLVSAADALGRTHRLDARWEAASGPPGLESAVDRLRVDALAAVRGGATLLIVSDAGYDEDRLPMPSVLAVGAVHAALTEAGLRGRADIVADVADVLDTHAAAMVLAVGATALRPRLAIELAAELAGSRGAEQLSAEDAVRNLLDGLEAGLRRTLARMGISTAASYIGGVLFESLELAPEVVERCFPAAPAWPGGIGFSALARRGLERRTLAARIDPATPPNRLRDPGLARFRSDGELHLFAPPVVGQLQAIARDGADPDAALTRYRAGLARTTAVVRDELTLRRVGRPVPLDEVEPVGAIVRRFVASAMSVGALSPEAHQAITIGIQRAGGAANTGEGGEDPAWYVPSPDGERRDARIKQVASARFGVTATYLARADQLEIKIAQGSKPGEGGHLPGRKATPYIAALRRGQPGQSFISPPPHHDIYSIEDLAQLISDLRAINPAARIGVKLVASRGIGTIAAGVAKAGADYIHVAGNSGGTGASPLASIKHVGAPFELGLAEVHQVLLRAGLRDRVALRTDGGLQTGRDVVVAALLGAEEFAFGTALLVALGCDMARQCHLDTCPTGIATQRDDLRAKFAGSPDDVARFATLIAEDARRQLAAIGARSIGEIVGRAAVHLRPATGEGALDVAALCRAPAWRVDDDRRAHPAAAADVVAREPASAVEHDLVAGLRDGRPMPSRPVPITTADRSLGAELSGALERGEIGRPLTLRLDGAAGQSFGAFLAAGIELVLAGTANDYVAKGLSGGTVVVAPEPDLAAAPERQAIVGNTCLYGATSGRLHVVGRAGMRFGVRNSGAEAVVEGLGPHGCEYMTGGVVVVLGPIGANFGAGMTGGRAYLHDPSGRQADALDARSVAAVRVTDARWLDAEADELRRLVEDHARAGSILAERLLASGLPLDAFWLVEPIETAIRTAEPTMAPQPDRNRLVAVAMPTGGAVGL
jgi:glutamate synthase domain-containing protein 2/glutamate synthase domain-containing protein 1/glutamate synthase domain-containing protein 3